MRLKKFTAPTLKEALDQTKAELGPDALVVATRQVRRGLFSTAMEVTAAIDAETPPAIPRPAALGRRLELPPAPERQDVLAPLLEEIKGLRLDLRATVERPSSPAPTRRPGPRRLRALAKAHELARPSAARHVALVGPTGAGKTTTVAKLAARAALVEGRSTALVCCDRYRVGGEAQLRAFAELIGIPLAVTDSPSDLPGLLAELRGHDVVFVDTAGRSPRDSSALAELDRALGSAETVETHLVLPAAASPASIDAWWAKFPRAAPRRLLFTKVDEAEGLTELVLAAARLGAPVAYLGTGQRVPEDLEAATSARLLDLATRGFAPNQEAA